MLLQIQATNHPPRQVSIRSARCSIGSGGDCTLRLVADGVEPLHCVLVRSDSEVTVQRVARATWLNQQEFRTAPFRPGDRLRVGPIEIQLLHIESGVKKSFFSELSRPSVPVSSPGGPMGRATVPETSKSVSQSQGFSAQVESSKSAWEEGSASEQTVRRLGHQRARRLIGLVRQAREEIQNLQQQIEELRRNWESLRTEEARLRSFAEQAAASHTKAHQLAELEARLNHRQADLDRREAQLEARHETLAYQWAEWKKEHEQLQQQLQYQAQALQQQQAEILASQKLLEQQLHQLQDQQHAFQQEQARLAEQQQALHAQQEALAQKELELSQWQQRLQSHQQALAEQEASLTEKEKMLAEQEASLAEKQQTLTKQELFLTEKQKTLAEQELSLAEKEKNLLSQPQSLQPQWESSREQSEQFRGGEPEELSSQEANVSEERIQRYTRPPEPRSTLHAEEILRRLGMMPDFEEEGTDGEPAHCRSPEVPQEERSQQQEDVSRRAEASHSASKSDEESVIHAYMERLLGRGWKQASSEKESPGQSRRHSPEGDSSEGAVEGESRESRSRWRPPRRQGTAEWSPRAAPPERGVNLEAMRTLANISAHKALERHHRQKAIAAVWAKFSVSLVGLLLGSGMLWVWGGNPEHELALYGAGVCFLVAALWGIQYLILVGKLFFSSFTRRPPPNDRLETSASSQNVLVPSEQPDPISSGSSHSSDVSVPGKNSFSVSESQKGSAALSSGEPASEAEEDDRSNPSGPESANPQPGR